MTHATVLLRPKTRLTPAQWIRRNLFNSWGNAILTILSVWLTFVLARGIIVWVFTTAEWLVIRTNLRLILLGQYPIAEVWRIWLSAAMLSFLIGSTVGVWGWEKTRPVTRRIWVALASLPLVFVFTQTDSTNRLWLAALSILAVAGWFLGRPATRPLRRIVAIGWFIWPAIFILLLRGLTPEEGWLPLVGTNLWGGLLLTFLLTVVGIVFSFPLGVLLALGRRSELQLVRWFSIGYIELIRGVPLITILFMAQLMLPLFLPTGLTIDRVLRAMVGITLFSAAYLAENVRGGLQAIPRGQFEAAHAMGLNGIQTMGLIVLPQALRLVIPILVGQFIALYKDTALVSIVGLLDIVGIGKTVLAQPEFLGLQREVLAFISLLYWVVSYAMSYVSQRLEIAVGVGER
ncbi:MAG: amino acid ABC transporter permease [Anaerolineae bacterium]|nr:MAG: amino acid ABC transporter permease [Anaerolineae bacterium]